MGDSKMANVFGQKLARIIALVGEVGIRKSMESHDRQDVKPSAFKFLQKPK